MCGLNSTSCGTKRPTCRSPLCTITDGQTPLFYAPLEYIPTVKHQTPERSTDDIYRATSASLRSSKVGIELHVETCRGFTCHTPVPTGIVGGLAGFQCQCHEKVLNVAGRLGSVTEKRGADRSWNNDHSERSGRAVRYPQMAVFEGNKSSYL